MFKVHNKETKNISLKSILASKCDYEQIVHINLGFLVLTSSKTLNFRQKTFFVFFTFVFEHN